MLYVCDGDIKRLEKLLTKNINPVPDTMQIHQIICDLKDLNTVLYRPPKKHTFTSHNVQQEPENNVVSETCLGPQKPTVELPEVTLPESLQTNKTLVSKDVCLITDFEIIGRENSAVSPELHNFISLQNETLMTDFEVAQYMNQNMCDGTELNFDRSPSALS